MGSWFSSSQSSDENTCSQHIEEITIGDQCLLTKDQAVVHAYNGLERENNRLQHENRTLCQQVLNLKSKINVIEMELEEKTESLSAYLSAQVSADERHLENIVETVRPSSLGKRYQQLESTEWLSAKEQIDNNSSIPSNDALRLLCFIMDEAYHSAGPEVMKREEEVIDVLLSPIQHHRHLSNGQKVIPGPQCTSDSPVISQTLKNEILKPMKKTSHLIDLSVLEENVKVKAVEKFSLHEGFFDRHDEALKYVTACCRLAWQFHLVRPPMVVSTEPTNYDKNIHNLWYDCDGNTNSEIRGYIWPILYNHKDGRVAAKGRVMVGKGQFYDLEERSSTYL